MGPTRAETRSVPHRESAGAANPGLRSECVIAEHIRIAWGAFLANGAETVRLDEGREQRGQSARRR
jgi:hypothetical protein